MQLYKLFKAWNWRMFLFQNTWVFMYKISPKNQPNGWSVLEGAGTFEQRAALPDGDGACGSVLTQAKLHEKQGHAREEEHDEVRDKKHTCSSTKNTVTVCLMICIKQLLDYSVTRKPSIISTLLYEAGVNFMSRLLAFYS